MTRRPPPLPTSIKVGHKRFAVARDDDTVERLAEETEVMLAGASNDHTARIALVSGVPHDTEAETLLHEIIHLALRASGCWPDDIRPGRHGLTVEEQVVAAITRPLLGVIRDHPEVVKFLSHEDPPPA